MTAMEHYGIRYVSARKIEAPPQAVTPAEAFNAEGPIAKAIEKKGPVDTMERIPAMRRDLKAEFAKEAFDQAMAKFPMECLVIEKRKSPV